MSKSKRARPRKARAASKVTKAIVRKSVAQRKGGNSKQEQVLHLLRQPSGATIETITHAVALRTWLLRRRGAQKARSGFAVGENRRRARLPHCRRPGEPEERGLDRHLIMHRLFGTARDRT